VFIQVDTVTTTVVKVPLGIAEYINALVSPPTGPKISAIKAFRQVTQLGLREAKLSVDRMQHGLWDVEYIGSQPVAVITIQS